MTSDETICRLELDSYGVPPRRSMIEARRLPEGFAVWHCDERWHPDGVELARRESAYSTLVFARIIRDFGIATNLSNFTHVPQDAWRAVRVTGERGLRAELLSIAYVRGREDIVYIFMLQSEASFDLLDSLIETFDDDWRSLLLRIDVCATRLYFDRDVLGLLRRYELPPSAAGLRELRELLGRALERQLKERRVEPDPRVAPFHQEIEAIAVKYSNHPCRAGGSMWPSVRCNVRILLEKYVIEHGRMPQGNVGEHGWLDLDRLRKFDRWPPDRPDDSPYCSEDGAP